MEYRASNSSASGSQSPSSENLSNNTSPASLTTPLSMIRSPDEIDPQNSRTSARSPHRTSVELPRPQSASRGGCWTCRLRRKKCDEVREGNSCQTCLRLRIECLGWGTKRPEWMRDKQAVEKYKADIKAQLTRAGLIRGQPRTSSLMQTVPSPSLVPSQPYGLPGPGPRTSSPRESRRSVDYGYAPAHHNPMMPMASGANTGSHHGLPINPYSDSNIDALSLHAGPSYSFPAQSPSGLSSPASGNTIDATHYELFPQALHPSSYEYELPAQNYSPVPGQNTMQGEYVLYYFEHVRRIQYIFAGNSVTNVTYSLIVQQPQGAVTNAVCALASLHYTRTHMAQGLEAPDPNLDNSTAKYFYDQAFVELANSKHVNGGYSEADAVAALHLISFSLFSGGTIEWLSALGVAFEWMANCGITSDENPKLTLLNMSAAGKLAVKTILWMDIMSSLTSLRPPKYLTFYRRLFGGGGYWSGSNNNYNLRMDSLSGCPDSVMLGIAEISALAHWKAQEQRNGSLSVRDLVRRGDDIERQIHLHSEPASFAEADQAPLHPNLPSVGGSHLGMSSPHASSQGCHPIGPFPSEDMRRVVAALFRETAVLFLHTVLSGPNPGVPEIMGSVDMIIQLFNQMPPSEVDRSLVFPICLAGCMTDNVAQRELLKSRLQTQDESIGNLLQTRTVMEAVWQQHDSQGSAVDWREAMQERGLNLLLV